MGLGWIMKISCQHSPQGEVGMFWALPTQLPPPGRPPWCLSFVPSPAVLLELPAVSARRRGWSTEVCPGEPSPLTLVGR